MKSKIWTHRLSRVMISYILWIEKQFTSSTRLKDIFGFYMHYYGRLTLSNTYHLSLMLEKGGICAAGADCGRTNCWENKIQILRTSQHYYTYTACDIYKTTWKLSYVVCSLKLGQYSGNMMMGRIACRGSRFHECW